MPDVSPLATEKRFASESPSGTRCEHGNSTPHEPCDENVTSSKKGTVAQATVPDCKKTCSVSCWLCLVRQPCRLTLAVSVAVDAILNNQCARCGPGQSAAGAGHGEDS